MAAETKISKDFKTLIPIEIRKRFKVRPGDIMEWKSTKMVQKLNFERK